MQMNYHERSIEERIQRNECAASTPVKQPYRSLLQEPTVSLARNPNDRPDVASVAILGYN
jgi:hypothetical protein